MTIAAMMTIAFFFKSLHLESRNSGTDRLHCCCPVLLSENRRSGDENRCARRDDSRRGLRVDAPVYLDFDSDSPLSNHLTDMTNLGDNRFDEALTAESGVDGHD